MPLSPLSACSCNDTHLMHESAVEQSIHVNLCHIRCWPIIGPPSHHPRIGIGVAIRRFAVSIAFSRHFRYEACLKTLRRADTPGTSSIVLETIAKAKEKLRKDLQVTTIWERSCPPAVEIPTTEMDSAHAASAPAASACKNVDSIRWWVPIRSRVAIYTGLDNAAQVGIVLVCD